jgi:hypothetical protein
MLNINMLFRTLLVIALLAVCCYGQGGTVEDRLKRKSGEGRRRRLAACPTMYTADAVELQGTDGWNVWSASCDMGSEYEVKSGKTVKIKKSASMVGELVIDLGSATGGYNRHFFVEVEGTLEMEDVTLTGAYSALVSSFCSFCCEIFILFDGDL